MVVATVFTFAETGAGGTDFDDIGASEYNAYASDDLVSGQPSTADYSSGVAYTTDDAPINSHDL